ncbi:MAG: ABC transporter ATP-binding protein [Candidatus Sumerlaeota bacterium]|nr:ABC transporter ATP-binding protein [Candidatus Sumerlaeota bacterium]
MPLIECQKLVCRFGAVAALDSLSASFEAGSWTYILGPSASGKTTLLRAIAGLQTMDAGEIRIEGAKATNARMIIPPHRRRMGFLFQDPSLWPHLSAGANVALGVAGGLSRRERNDRARQWLEKLGAAHLENKFPAQLSGGESQRVALARTLASEPKVLLLDEPAARLDAHLCDAMMEELIRIHQELELTTLCVTHLFDYPMKSSDRMIALERGALQYDGPVAGIPSAPSTPFIAALQRKMGRISP